MVLSLFIIFISCYRLVDVIVFLYPGLKDKYFCLQAFVTGFGDIPVTFGYFLSGAYRLFRGVLYEKGVYVP